MSCSYDIGREGGREGEREGKSSCPGSENVSVFSFISPGPKSVFVPLIGGAAAAASALYCCLETERAAEFEDDKD